MADNPLYTEALKDFNRSHDKHAAIDGLTSGRVLCGIDPTVNVLRTTDYDTVTCRACLGVIVEATRPPAREIPAPTLENLPDRFAHAAKELDAALQRASSIAAEFREALRDVPSMRLHLWSRTVHDESGYVRMSFDGRDDVTLNSNEALSITVPGDHPLAKLEPDEDYVLSFTPAPDNG